MKTSGLTKAESVWRERVQSWRASGATEEEFARSQGFAPSMLRTWARRLAVSDGPRFFRVITAASRELAPPARALAEMIVEVGGARVRVRAGFDEALLAQVVRVLSGGAR